MLSGRRRGGGKGGLCRPLFLESVSERGFGEDGWCMLCERTLRGRFGETGDVEVEYAGAVFGDVNPLAATKGDCGTDDDW